MNDYYPSGVTTNDIDRFFGGESHVDEVGDNYLPEEVFTFHELEEWALENGFEKVGDDA